MYRNRSAAGGTIPPPPPVNIESEIATKLIMSHQNVAHSSEIKEVIKNFEFVQVVALIKKVVNKLNCSEMVKIICDWAEGNDERINQNLGELLMICDQLRNECVPPRPPTIVQKPPSRIVSSYSTTTHPRPQASLLFGDDDSGDSDYSDDW